MAYFVKDFTNYLEKLAPLATQESYDNSGLIVGSKNQEVTGVLLSLDCVESVIDEAIQKNCNLIIAHHPIVFKGLKQLNGKNYVERTVIKAIKHDIAIYAIHTNLDNYRFGVNARIGELLGLSNLEILAPTDNKLTKIAVFCPSEYVEKVRAAMFEAGAGHIGDYAECSFISEGQGTFAPQEGTDPFIGELGKQEQVREKKIEMIFPTHLKNYILTALKDAHPYEEVAYDLFELLNENQFEGAGMIGELEKEIDVLDFLNHVKQTFNCGVVKHTPVVKQKVKKIAFCGGAGSFLLSNAIHHKADVYISGDFKYHEFFDAENHLMIADIGHYESEQFTPNLIHAILKENFINFALHLSKVNTNPINYL